MSVKEALQKPGVKKDCADAFDGQHEGRCLSFDTKRQEAFLQMLVIT